MPDDHVEHSSSKCHSAFGVEKTCIAGSAVVVQLEYTTHGTGEWQEIKLAGFGFTAVWKHGENFSTFQANALSQEFYRQMKPNMCLIKQDYQSNHVINKTNPDNEIQSKQYVRISFFEVRCDVWFEALWRRTASRYFSIMLQDLSDTRLSVIDISKSIYVYAWCIYVRAFSMYSMRAITLSTRTVYVLYLNIVLVEVDSSYRQVRQPTMPWSSWRLWKSKVLAFDFVVGNNK